MTDSDHEPVATVTGSPLRRTVTCTSSTGDAAWPKIISPCNPKSAGMARAGWRAASQRKRQSATSTHATSHASDLPLDPDADLRLELGAHQTSQVEPHFAGADVQTVRQDPADEWFAPGQVSVCRRWVEGAELPGGRAIAVQPSRTTPPR